MFMHFQHLPEPRNARRYTDRPYLSILWAEVASPRRPIGSFLNPSETPDPFC